MENGVSIQDTSPSVLVKIERILPKVTVADTQYHKKIIWLHTWISNEKGTSLFVFRSDNLFSGRF